MSVHVSEKHLRGFVSEHEFAAMAPQVETAHTLLHSKTGPGNDFWDGWNCRKIMIAKNLRG